MRIFASLLFCFPLLPIVSVHASDPVLFALGPRAEGFSLPSLIDSWRHSDLKPPQPLLLLKETKVYLEVTGTVLYADVEQLFFNDTGETVEVQYTFPISDKATVTGMTMILGDHIVTSVVQEKKSAKATYDAAATQGKQAALLEQDRPNVFTAKINKLHPGEEVKVTFQYVEPLSYASGRYQVVFPTTFGSRYLPVRDMPDSEAGNALVEQSRLNPLYVDQTENQFSLEALVLGLPLEEIQSNTHNLYLKDEGEMATRVVVDLADFLPNRDVILNLQLADSAEPQSRMLQSYSQDGVHGLLNIFPPLGNVTEVQSQPKEVVFIIDTSGSMTGVAMEQARDGLKACLAMLNPDDRFNIVAYDDSFQMFAPEFAENSPENHLKGLKFANYLHADGGTELQPALKAVLEMERSHDHLPWIVLLTDGDVGNETELLALVHQSEARNRIFSFGLGSAPNRYLLTKLGEVGGGFATFIDPGLDLTQTMKEFFESVLVPVLTDISIEFRQPDGHLAQVEYFPGTPPDVYLDRPLQLSVHSELPLDGKVWVKGVWQGEEIQFEVPIPQAEMARYEGIDKLFGKAWLDDLMVNYFTAPIQAVKERVEADIVATALRYQLVTPFTSRVAVTKLQTTQPGHALASAMVPLLQPESRIQYPVTATQDWFWLASGLSLMLLAGFWLKRSPMKSV